MRVEYYIANIPKLKIAEALQEIGYAGTIYDTIGFGGGWGIEDSVKVEMSEIGNADLHEIDNVIRVLLIKYREESALRVLKNDQLEGYIDAYPA